MLEHRLAKIAACAAFVVLVIGGMVNATGSSLACPEAFVICHKSLLPPMVGGVLYEHGHRLAAMSLGLLQIALTIAMWRRRPELRWLGVLLLGMILAQGLFGATTVHYKLLWWVSTGHLLLGMTYAAMLGYAAFRLRPLATVPQLDQHDRRMTELGRARTWIAVACIAVFAQMLLGALVRHFGAWMACIGMPACTSTGEWFPEMFVQRIHMIHRAFGIVVALVTSFAAIQVWRHARSWGALRWLALVAPVLVVEQVTLGVLVVLTHRMVPVAVAHFAVAAGMWAVWMTMWLMTGKRR